MTEQSVRRDLTQGSIPKNIWRLALPMMGANIFQDLFNLVDMFFVGKLGPSAIAAVAMSGILLMLGMTIGMGISIGTIAMISRFAGAGKREKVQNVAAQAIFLGLISSLVLGVVGYSFASPILSLLGASKDVLPLGVAYVKIIALGSITLFLTIALNSSLQGIGDVVTPLKILTLSTILNIGFDPLLIFGIWRFPKMGVAGSALATVIARGIGLIFLLYLSHPLFKLRDMRIDWAIIRRIVRIGIFGSLQMLTRNLAALVLIRIVAIYGTFALAAYGVGMRLRMAVMMPGFGLANAAAILVGQNLGANRPDRAERSGWLATGFYEIIAISAAVLFILFSKGLIKVFNTNPEVIKLGSLYLRFLAFSFFFIALSVVLGRAMGGAGETRSPMLVTALSLFGFQIPLALILARFLNLRTTGIWAAILISSIVQGIVMTLLFLRGKWKRRRV